MFSIHCIQLVCWAPQDRISMILTCNRTSINVRWSWKTVWSGASLHRPVLTLSVGAYWIFIEDCSPDSSLGCYPYVKNDPFIIHDTPHVFFAGNQLKYETRVFQGKTVAEHWKTSIEILDANDLHVRLVCIPQFAQSYSCVALNLRTLECTELSFQNETIQVVSWKASVERQDEQRLDIQRFPFLFLCLYCKESWKQSIRWI